MFEQGLGEIFKKVLIEYNFKFPITWTLIGINGHVFAERFEFPVTEKGPRTTIVTGKVKKLRFPINAMLVDATGKAMHILFKNSMQLGEMNRLHTDEPSPAALPPWSGGAGKA